MRALLSMSWELTPTKLRLGEGMGGFSSAKHKTVPCTHFIIFSKFLKFKEEGVFLGVAN